MPRPLKIIQAIDAGGWGGSEKVVVTLSNELANKGHNVSVWVRKNSRLIEYLNSNVKVKEIPFLNDYDPLTVTCFYKALYENDIVHVHLGRAAKLSGWASSLIPDKNVKKRLITHIHGMHRKKHYCHQHQAICVSHNILSYVKKVMPWISNAVVIPNGISYPTSVEKIVPLISRDPKTIQLGMLASFKEEKGHKDMLKILSILLHDQGYRNIKLLLGGKGPLLNEIKKMSTALGLDSNIEFLGEISPKKVFSFWKSVDIGCFPSNKEGLSMSLLEAISVSCPVVAYDGTGMTEVLSGVKCMVPQGDKKAFSSLLQEMIMSSEKRLRLGKQLYLESKRFTIAHMVDQIENAYEVFLGRCDEKGGY